MSIFDRIHKWLVDHGWIKPDPVPPAPKPKPKPKPDPGPNPSPTPSPAPAPTPTPVPIPPHTTGQVRAAMFIPAKVPQAPWIVMGPPWPDSTDDYARSHGKPWENDYRHWCVTALQSWGATAIFYFADKLFRAIELEMYLCDTASPADGHHIADADNAAGWLKQVGVTTHVVALSDSPDVTIPWAQFDPFVKDIVSAFASARGITAIYHLGLECNRNQSAADVAARAAIVRKYAGPDARVVCGSQDLSYMKAVHAADAGIELGLEQAGHPINQPLTTQTAPVYLQGLDTLAGLIGPGRVWANEWWAADEATRLTITSQILSRGYNLLCGQFKSALKAGPLNRRIVLDNSMCMGSGIIAGN